MLMLRTTPTEQNLIRLLSLILRPPFLEHGSPVLLWLHRGRKRAVIAAITISITINIISQSAIQPVNHYCLRWRHTFCTHVLHRQRLLRQIQRPKTCRRRKTISTTRGMHKLDLNEGLYERISITSSGLEKRSSVMESDRESIYYDGEK